MNKGSINNNIYTKEILFSTAVLWRDKMISLNKAVVDANFQDIKTVEFIDRYKGEKWTASLVRIKKCWELKKVGQEEQYYIPIEIFKKEKIVRIPRTEAEKMEQDAKLGIFG